MTMLRSKSKLEASASVRAPDHSHVFSPMARSNASKDSPTVSVADVNTTACVRR